MSTKEIQEKLASDMARWQKVEAGTVEYVGQIIEETDNPIIKLVMDIIRRDSEMHHRTQQLIIDSMKGTGLKSPSTPIKKPKATLRTVQTSAWPAWL